MTLGGNSMLLGGSQPRASPLAAGGEAAALGWGLGSENRVAGLGDQKGCLPLPISSLEALIPILPFLRTSWSYRHGGGLEHSLMWLPWVAQSHSRAVGTHSNPHLVRVHI